MLNDFDLALPQVPQSWYFFCAEKALDKGPVSRMINDRELVAFRTESGVVAVLDGRCPHMGISLAKGVVKGQSIQCALHHWCFSPEGHCTHIPAQSDIPEPARVRSYPCELRHGMLFFFYGPKSLFPLPFYLESNPEAFCGSLPFRIEVGCPWFMLSGHHFDEQHIGVTHEREMLGPSSTSLPHRFARRAAAKFAVSGRSFRDSIWRALFGTQVEFDNTTWAGTISCTEARFRRTTSYGMTFLAPMSADRTEVIFFAFARLGGGPAARLRARMHARVRRYFIARFLEDDWTVLHGARYNPRSLLRADEPFRDYMTWLKEIAVSVPEGKELNVHTPKEVRLCEHA